MADSKNPTVTGSAKGIPAKDLIGRRFKIAQNGHIYEIKSIEDMGYVNVAFISGANPQTGQGGTVTQSVETIHKGEIDGSYYILYPKKS